MTSKSDNSYNDSLHQDLAGTQTSQDVGLNPVDLYDDRTYHRCLPTAPSLPGYIVISVSDVSVLPNTCPPILR